MHQEYTNKTKHFQEAHKSEAGSLVANRTLVTAARFGITDNTGQTQQQRATVCFDPLLHKSNVQMCKSGPDERTAFVSSERC